MAGLKPSLEIARTDTGGFALGRPPIAKFQGSFVGERPVEQQLLLGNHVRAKRKTRMIARLGPLGKGWNDVGIWKGAVGNSISLSCGKG